MGLGFTGLIDSLYVIFQVVLEQVPQVLPIKLRTPKHSKAVPVRKLKFLPPPRCCTRRATWIRPTSCASVHVAAAVMTSACCYLLHYFQGREVQGLGNWGLESRRILVCSLKLRFRSVGHRPHAPSTSRLVTCL